VHACVYLRVYLCIYLSVCPCVCVSICVWIFLSVCLSIVVCLSVWLSVCLSVCLSICLFVCLSLCFSIRLSVCLSTYLPVREPVSACVFTCVRLHVRTPLNIYLPLFVWESVFWMWVQHRYVTIFCSPLPPKLFVACARSSRTACSCRAAGKKTKIFLIFYFWLSEILYCVQREMSKASACPHRAPQCPYNSESLPFWRTTLRQCMPWPPNSLLYRFCLCPPLLFCGATTWMQESWRLQLFTVQIAFLFPPRYVCRA